MAELVVGSDPDAARRARRLIRSTLAERLGAVEDAELVVTELVTNALLHAGPPVTVRLTDLDCGVRLEVEDRGRTIPVQGLPSTESMTGRGLSLIAALASGW